ncbi:GNAT family N-acetyltransferase [Streptomyces sp. A7024]|uniref:GNAT family N-acetyltransferase n=1 Tax=Streptomyces coryli TaxID=1128680 RepID=A0A6G4TXL1_9ACTN|nr:GNAT family N-acetyltransferase [Streptomyces coryli]NGN64553.1 GNAT family N-acetyltransferase [Streptomyces coryli]
MNDITIRRAEPRDARRLTAIMRASRAYEGRYASIIEGYRVSTEYIHRHEVYVAADDTRVLGFYSIVLDPPELDLLFVSDAAQGRGVGRRLLAHARDRARAAGLDGLRIVAHPPAEDFYLSQGARRTGTVLAKPPAVQWDRPDLWLDAA